jgi:hypothetical protein
MNTKSFQFLSNNISIQRVLQILAVQDTFTPQNRENFKITSVIKVHYPVQNKLRNPNC